jgi:O-antigen/teichoic acid export membrane protein
MKSRIASNSVYNLAGSIVPLVTSFVTVPLFLHRIGETRYGILALTWLFAGYFGIFDMGLSRATSNLIARLHDQPDADRRSVFFTALMINGAFGMAGALLLWVTGGFLLAHFFKIPSSLQREVLGTIPWIAASVPSVTVTGVAIGALEARGRFLQVNSLQVFGSFLTQVVPLSVAYLHGPDLSWLIPSVILSRLLTLCLLLVSAMRSISANRPARPNRRWARELLGYGGWVTVTNMMDPILTTTDQFMVGAVLGAKSVASYNVPFNLAARLGIFPMALIRTLFPEFSRLQSDASTDLARYSMRFICVCFAPVIVLAMLGLKPFLTVWIDPDFAVRAAPVGLIFLLGTWINATSYVPFAFLQASGRPGVAAKIHLLEVLPFIGLLWFAAHTWGLVGAALSWTARVTLDSLLMRWMARLGMHDIFELLSCLLIIACALAFATLVPFTSVWYPLGSVTLIVVAGGWSLLLEPRLVEMFRGGLERLGVSIID